MSSEASNTQELGHRQAPTTPGSTTSPQTDQRSSSVTEERIIQPAFWSNQLFGASQPRRRRPRPVASPGQPNPASQPSGRTFQVSQPPRQLAAVSHTSSRKWVSDEVRRHQKWERVWRSLCRQFPRSELVHWTFGDYVQHLTEEACSAATRAQTGMRRTASRSSPRSLRLPAVEALMGCKPCDQFATVLLVETVWRPDFSCNEVSWPGLDEMRYEGDGRMKGDGFGRRLAIPRARSNGEASFRHVPWVRPLPFDDFERPPMVSPAIIEPDFDGLLEEESAFLAELLEEQAASLIGNSLLSAIEGVSAL